MESIPTTQTLFLDFDGVIADSLEESLLVSWYGGGRGQWSPCDRPDELAARVPDGYRRRFQEVRSYARTLEEFLVPALDGVPAPRSQAEFTRAFGGVPEVDKLAFVDEAQRFRDFLRTEHFDAWAGMHELYPGVPELMRRFAGRTHIVTAKDDLSARAVLRMNGLEPAVASVTGGASDKAVVIRSALAAEGEEPGREAFVDDNLANVAHARSAGLRAYWATWGWQRSTEHREEARRLGLSLLTLEGLARIGREA